VETLLIIVLAAALVVCGALWYRTSRRLNEERARALALNEQIEALKRLEIEIATLKALSEVAYNALILVDARRQIIHMNEAACRLFGCELEARSQLQDTLMTVTRDYELDELAAQALEEHEAIGQQLTIRGTAYRVRAQRSDTPGGPVLALALEDVSELQRLGRARRDMVANISHELRTPISSIRLLVDTLLRDEEDLKKRAAKRLHKIAAETDALQQMAQELLDLSMIESGRAEFIFVPVKVEELFADVAERFAEQAQREEIAVETLAPPDLVVLADAQQVRRALANLMHNAIKFSPPGSRVQVSAELRGDQALIAVTDSGPGIPSEERTRVFERFYRGDRARQGGGTGLGLAIAKHIVEAHGGTIWAEEPPTPPGARLCFTLALPPA
jgi:two-component system phosphate regulon sensor histidine kinase PhoR